VIHLPASVRVYLCTSPCDMRRSFDGLHALVTGAMKLDAFAGHLFVFANRRKDQERFSIPIGVCRRRVPLAPPTWEEASAVSTNRSCRCVRHSR
jgi:transposase